MKGKKILVTGSLAFDHIMDFPGRFADHILPDKIHVLNLSFLVDTLKKQWGGTAGNIAYNLGMLGEKPFILAGAGNDFGLYAAHLKSVKVNLSLVKISPYDSTAISFIVTDRSDNQIASFYPGAMSWARDLSLKRISFRPDLVIVSANDSRAMVGYCRECQQLKIPYLFDPGQQIPRLSRADIIKCIDRAEIVIGNDYEFELVKKKTGFNQRQILRRVRQALIITKGAEGSVIFTKKDSVNIPAVKAKKIIDPTGAGDAYRAGIIKGLISGWDWLSTGRLAALAAVYAVERHGTQEHSYTLGDIIKRYRKNFGELPKKFL